MKRVLLCVGMLLYVAMMMGADLPDNPKGTPIQQEMAELLLVALDLPLLPKELTKPGEEYTFEVTDRVAKNLQGLRESDTPIRIARTSELATKKGDVLKAMGFIPRNDVVNAADPYLYDITDITIKNMRGMTITILADGTVKQRVTR